MFYLLPVFLLLTLLAVVLVAASQSDIRIRRGVESSRERRARLRDEAIQNELQTLRGAIDRLVKADDVICEALTRNSDWPASIMIENKVRKIRNLAQSVRDLRVEEGSVPVEKPIPESVVEEKKDQEPKKPKRVVGKILAAGVAMFLTTFMLFPPAAIGGQKADVVNVVQGAELTVMTVAIDPGFGLGNNFLVAEGNHVYVRKGAGKWFFYETGEQVNAEGAEYLEELRVSWDRRQAAQSVWQEAHK